VHKRTTSPEAYRCALLRDIDPETPWDFHRSMPSTIVLRRYHQTPRQAAGNTRMNPMKMASCRPMLQRVGGLGTLPRPKRDTSRAVLAWPLRRRQLPSDAGCVPLNEFEQVFLYRYGPAQVGFHHARFLNVAAPFKTEPTAPAAHTPRWSVGTRLKNPLAPWRPAYYRGGIRMPEGNSFRVGLHPAILPDYGRRGFYTIL
jgi:hypothetical protein